MSEWRRLGRAIVLTLGLVLAAPAASAAAVPKLKIESPPSGSTIHEATPVVSGTSSDHADPVSVEIFEGAEATVSPYEVLAPAHPSSSGTWSTTALVPLLPGLYTARAKQGALLNAAEVTTTFTYEPAAPGGVVRYELTPTPTPPKASLTWTPASPAVGEPVSLVSTSTAGSAAISSYAWDPAGTGHFIAGGPVFTTSFASPGAHVVALTVTDADGTTSTAHVTIHVHFALMQPFPIVRIAGVVTARGARIRLLAVQAPPRAVVTTRCRGRGCCTRYQSRLVGVTAASARTGVSLLSFKRFERSLRGGAVLQIVVTRANEIGKYASLLIRRGKLPVRHDACVQPGDPRPVPCPPK